MPKGSWLPCDVRFYYRGRDGTRRYHTLAVGERSGCTLRVGPGLFIMVLLLLTACAGASNAGVVPQASDTSVLQVVRNHIAAFNDKDVAALVGNISTDFVWYSVGSDSIAVEVRGRGAFESGMRSYFAAVPDVQSSIDGIAVSGPFVSFRERVSWVTRTGEPRSQTALAVYEIRDGLVRRAWYYPEQR